jgi:hypothetical protein
MAIDVYFNELAETLVEGIDFDNMHNDSGGLTRASLKQINKLPDNELIKDVKKNARKTIKKLEASANKKEIDFGRNVELTTTGTVQAELVNSVDIKDDQMIEWLPSDADEADPQHARNYNKVMTWATAKRKGLSTRIGCKCGAKVIKPSSKLTKQIKEIK